MMRLLMLTDFSEPAQHAIEYGCKLLQHVNGEGLIAHVFDLPVIDAEVPLTIYEETVEKTEAEVRKQLGAIAHECHLKYSLSNLRTLYQTGDVVKEALAIAQDWNPDYILVGSKQSASTWQMLLGSTTVSLLESSPWPIWVVPYHALIGLPKRMMYISSLMDDPFFSIVDFSYLVRRLNSNFVYLHIHSGKNHDPLHQRRKSILIRFLQQWIPHFTYSELYYQSPHQLNEQFDAFIKEKDIHMMGIHQRHKGAFNLLFGRSLTYQVLYHTRVPLIVYP